MPRRIGLLLAFVVVAVFSLPFPQAFSVTRLIWHIMHSSGVGTNYYIANEGSNSNPGTISSPWQTIANIYGHGPYKAGDQILFKGGQTFTGSLYLDNTVSTATASRPLVISSYGTGTATLSSTTDGIFLYRLGNVSISNLNLVGGGANATDYTGILLGNDQASLNLGNVSVSNVNVGSFSSAGMYGYITGSSATYSNITVNSSRFHDNKKNGLFFWSSATPGTPTISNLYIGSVESDHNGGAVEGSGILFNSTSNATVEYCNTHDNFRTNSGTGGPYGLWMWDSDGVIIQYNESHHNATNTTHDGGGFDIDVGMRNSTAQYNYSHDNAGPGYNTNNIAIEGVNNTNNAIRYNISQNDGQTTTGAPGLITVWTDAATSLVGTKIYNNTLYDNTTNSIIAPIYMFGDGSVNTVVYNNIFVSTGGKPMAHIDGTHTGLVIKGNDYWGNGSGFNVYYNGATYTTLAAFRTASGQETGAGLNVDPLLVSPGTGGTLWPAAPQTLAPYKLQAGSPMIDQGQNLPGLGISVGLRDFFGGPIPLGAGYDIGAHERQ